MPEHKLPKIGWGDVVAVGTRAIPEEGIRRLELNDVADELGVEEAAVKYWFEDIGQVLVAVMEIRKNWFLDEARARMAPFETQTERMRAFIELSAADHDAIFWIELWRLATTDESARRARQSLADSYRRIIAGMVRAGQRSGEFGPASPDKVALVLAALISGLSVNATLDDPEVTPEAMLDTLLRVTEGLLQVEGLRTSGRSSKDVAV